MGSQENLQTNDTKKIKRLCVSNFESKFYINYYTFLIDDYDNLQIKKKKSV